MAVVECMVPIREAVFGGLSHTTTRAGVLCVSVRTRLRAIATLFYKPPESVSKKGFL